MTKAGGATDIADVHRLNLAAKIHDGQQIDIPEISQVTMPATDVSRVERSAEEGMTRNTSPHA